MNAGIRELLKFLAVVVVAIAILLGALLLDGCSHAPEVRTERRVTTSEILRGAAHGVDALAEACPLPFDRCVEVRRWGAVLSDGLHATADALIAGEDPVAIGVCLAPLVGSFLGAVREARTLDVPPVLALGLDVALSYLPDCPVDE
jgi:hypothetical protein